VIAGAVTTVVERHHGVSLREPFDVISEVFLCPTVSVNQEQAGTCALDFHVEFDSIVGPDSHGATPRSMHHRRRVRRTRATLGPVAGDGSVGCPLMAQPTTPAGGLPEAGGDAGRASARWKLLLRMVVSAGVLAVLVLKTPHLDGVLPRHDQWHSTFLLAAALLLILVGIVLSAWRWQQVLHAFDEHVGLGTLTAYTLAGQFVGNVLPSTIGGDVVRVSRLGATIDSTETAFASVAIERLTGFIALPALVVTGFVLRPSLADRDHAVVALGIAAIAVGALAAILVAAAHPRLAGRFAGNDNWMRFIGAVHVGVDRLRRQPRAALGVVGTSLAYQMSVIAAVLCIVRTLDLPVATAAVVAFVPAVAMAQVVPISVGGLGVREGMLVLFLHSFAVSNAEAIAVGLLWYACLLVASMLGAPAFAVGKRERHRVAAPTS
jgi:uncharacterized membrane protein YbhN (UPF0104 family)